MDLADLYRDVILDHNRQPRNFGPMDPADVTMEGFNPLCGDEIVVYLDVDDAGVVTDVRIGGTGCSISQSSRALTAACRSSGVCASLIAASRPARSLAAWDCFWFFSIVRSRTASGDWSSSFTASDACASRICPIDEPMSLAMLAAFAFACFSAAMICLVIFRLFSTAAVPIERKSIWKARRAGSLRRFSMVSWSFQEPFTCLVLTVSVIDFDATRAIWPTRRITLKRACSVSTSIFSARDFRRSICAFSPPTVAVVAVVSAARAV